MAYMYRDPALQITDYRLHITDTDTDENCSGSDEIWLTRNSTFSDRNRIDYRLNRLTTAIPDHPTDTLWQ
jgi:hypothetical protein